MDTRTIDVAKTASIDLMNLNNKVVNMRPVVKRSKAQLVNRLCRHISTLKKKKGSEAQKEKNIRKAERLIEEIESMRRLKEDKVSKYSLANTTPFESLSTSTISPNLRALARLADHHLMKTAVNEFREKHSDWRDLAAFLLVKQTGRKFKTKKQKQMKLAKRVENINASETMTKAYVHGHFGEEGVEKAEQRFLKNRMKKKDFSKESQNIETRKDCDNHTENKRAITETDKITTLSNEKDSESVSDTENSSIEGDKTHDALSGLQEGDKAVKDDNHKASTVQNKQEKGISTKLKTSTHDNVNDMDETVQESKDNSVGKVAVDKEDMSDDKCDNEEVEEEDEEDDSGEEEDDGSENEKAESDLESEENSSKEDCEDSNETESDVVEDEDSESDDEMEMQESDVINKPKIPGIDSSKSAECVVKELRIGVSDDEESEDDDEASAEDSDDSPFEEEADSDDFDDKIDESDSEQPQKKRKVAKELKSNEYKSAPDFLTKRDQVLKNTPKDPFFVGSDGEEEGNVIRYSEMDFERDVDDGDYSEEGRSWSKSQGSTSVFYEPGDDNFSRRRFEKRDSSSGFNFGSRGRFENRGRGRSLDRGRGAQSHRGQSREGNVYFSKGKRIEVGGTFSRGERRDNKFGGRGSRYDKRGSYSSRGSTGRGRGSNQFGNVQQSTQQFGSHSGKDANTASTSTEKLHPSWEASRKRKAQQQGGLKAFEGSKIVFADD